WLELLAKDPFAQKKLEQFSGAFQNGSAKPTERSRNTTDLRSPDEGCENHDNDLGSPEQGCENFGRSAHGTSRTGRRLLRWSTTREGLLLYKRRYYVPNDEDLRLEILHEHHDSKAAGHFGTDKTIDLVFRNLFWQNMYSFIL